MFNRQESTYLLNCLTNIPETVIVKSKQAMLPPAEVSRNVY